MVNFIKKNIIHFILIISVFTMLVSCDSQKTEDANTYKQGENESLENIEKDIINEIIPQMAQNMSNVEYIEYLAEISNLEPSYKMVFAFENLENGMSSLPFENVISMYDELMKSFDYRLVQEHNLEYRGNYTYSEDFVLGYEDYKQMGDDKVFPNPINTIAKDSNGNEIMLTPLKTLMINENVASKFDENIIEGRNFQTEDFVIQSKDESIKIILGDGYKDRYKIGDIINMDLFTETMNFEVICFLESNVSFRKGIGANLEILLDYRIVMPHIIPMYNPVGESETWQHAFHIGELLSGYIKIETPTKEINEDIFNNYQDDVSKIAQKYDLTDMYVIPLWPDGFIW